MPGDLGDRLAGSLSDRLSPTVTALREAVEVLARREQGSRAAAPDRLAEELSRVMQQTMAAPIQELNQAIQTLARSVEELKRDRTLQPISDEFEFERFNEMPTAGLEQDVPPEVEPDDSMLGLRWFASWRQGASMKGAA